MMIKTKSIIVFSICLILVGMIGCKDKKKHLDKNNSLKAERKDTIKMHEQIKIITGKENTEGIQNQEIIALSNFYKAFNDRDMKLMQNVWLNSEEASMNNPLGGIMRNWEEIRNVYDRIFNGKAKVYVEFYDFTIHKTDNMFFATGRERGYFKTDEKEIALAIRTSRIFKKVNGLWKQIQHHGSIDNPELLKTYQDFVKK